MLSYSRKYDGSQQSSYQDSFDNSINMEVILKWEKGVEKAHNDITPKRLRHILDTNCENVPHFRAVRKKVRKSCFFQIQLYKFLLEYYWNVWQKFQKLCLYGLKDYNIWS